MKIAGEYSFNGGKEYIEANYPQLLSEIRDVIKSVDANRCKDKTSKEKTMPGRTLFSPISLNNEFDKEFRNKAWSKVRVPCKYSRNYYTPGYAAPPLRKGAFREMDFVKEKLGIEVQFGKYAFMVYNVCAKMTIFHKLGYIDSGVEIVPVKSFADSMSTGVSYFEQFMWDLDNRGVADIDIPVLIIGIDR